MHTESDHLDTPTARPIAFPFLLGTGRVDETGTQGKRVSSTTQQKP